MTFLLTFFLGVVGTNRFLFQAFAATEAEIIRVDFADHDRMFYSYSVKGTNFTGTGTGQVWSGTKIKAFYILSDPSVSTVDDPSGGFTGLFGRALLSATVLSIMMTIMVYGYAYVVLAVWGRPPIA